MLGVLAVASAAVAIPASPASSGLAVVNPDATIVVSDLTPKEGDTITVENASNSDSTCEDGLAVVFINGLPPGELSQKTDEPDANGDWEVEVFFPFQADWPSNHVGGPFEIEAFCTEQGGGGTVSPQAPPEFGYVPVTVTLEQPAVVTPPIFTDTPGPGTAPVQTTPNFTG
jgi:hypothetical protein